MSTFDVVLLAIVVLLLLLTISGAVRRSRANSMLTLALAVVVAAFFGFGRWIEGGVHKTEHEKQVVRELRRRYPHQHVVDFNSDYDLATYQLPDGHSGAVLSCAVPVTPTPQGPAMQVEEKPLENCSELVP